MKFTLPLILVCAVILCGCALQSCISLTATSGGEAKTSAKTTSSTSQQSEQQTSIADKTTLKIEPIVEEIIHPDGTKTKKITTQGIIIETGTTTAQKSDDKQSAFAKAMADADAKAKARAQMQINMQWAIIIAIIMIAIISLVKWFLVSKKIKS